MSKDSIVNKAIGYSNSYKDGLFPNTIEKEINDILLKYENDIRKEIQDHVTDYKWLYEKKYIDIFEYNDWVKNGIKPRKPRYKQRYAYHKLGEEIRNIPLDEAGNISDIIEGVTYGKVNVRIGHRAGYWKKRKDIITGRNNGVGLEAFAEMIDATFSNKKNLDMIKKYIPKSYDLFLKMIEEI